MASSTEFSTVNQRLMLGTLPVQEQAGILWLPLHRPLCSERVVFATWQDLGLSPMAPGKPPPGNPPPGKPLRANLHRANLSQANTLKKKHFESGCRALRQPGKLTEMFLGNRAPHSGHTMHSSITQECVRLACAGGRDTRQGTTTRACVCSLAARFARQLKISLQLFGRHMHKTAL
jgi:hypothetical protein